MLSSKFRPWGQLNWILDKVGIPKWHFIGCVSTEDRCVSAYEILLKNDALAKATFIEIVDPPSHSDREIKKKITDNKNKLAGFGLPIVVEQMNLLCDDYEIFDLSQDILKTKPQNVIIDITSFPKRYFFPLIKLVSRDVGIENIVITYTQPEKYANEDLSDDPEPWYPLPLFMSTEFPEPKFDLAFVGTGFMPFSLPKLLKDNHSEISLRLFFPFPPGPPNYQRSWEFIRKIEKHYNFKDHDRIARVDALDINGTYNYIKSVTDNGEKKCLFAPYGPKPISLAMCLFAINNDSPVYYTQPKYYNPNYSKGAKETFAYCIRLFNNNLFS